MGMDVDRAAGARRRDGSSCAADVPAETNAGLWLGTVMGRYTMPGTTRSRSLRRPNRALLLWVEQLIAESTGKEGKGIIPVGGEPLGAPAVYGADRLFVYIRIGRRRRFDAR